MKRSIKAAFAIALVALVVPAAALATRHDGRQWGHHQTGSTGGTSVGSFDQSSGTLTLDLANGGSVTGIVGDGTRIVCLGDWRDFFFNRHGRFRQRFAKLTRTTLVRDRFQHGNSGNTGSTGSTGSTGGSGSTGGQGYGHGHGHGHGYPPPSGGTGGQGYGNGNGNQGNDHYRHHNYGGPPRHERCDSSLLVPGVSIRAASLEIGSQGAQFGEIVLLPAVQ